MNQLQKTLLILSLAACYPDTGSVAAYTVSRSYMFSDWQKFLFRMFSSNAGNVRHIRPIPRDACPEFDFPKVPDSKL